MFNYPSRTVETTIWDKSVFARIYKNNNKFTYDKFKTANSDSAYSICFSQVVLVLFSFLINTAGEEIYNIYQ